MSFNSTAFLADRERLLEPDSVIRTGSYRRYTETSMAAKNKWYDGLAPEEREQLRLEAEYEDQKRIYQQ